MTNSPALPPGFATTLDRVLAERRGLTCGEVVGLGVTLAHALVPSHVEGVRNGPISNERVLVRPSGSVALGTHDVGPATGSWTTSDDVIALAVWLRSLPVSLCGSVAHYLEQVEVGPAPAVGTFAATLHDLCEPRPLGLRPPRVRPDAVPNAEPWAPPGLTLVPVFLGTAGLALAGWTHFALP